MATISIVIVSYQTREVLRHCLASIGAGDAQEVIVVDNGSTDGSIEMVATDFPWVKLLGNAENIGYGAAANQAIAASRADYILLLNSDTLLQTTSAQALRAYLDAHPHVAVVGPRLLNADSSLQASCYPFPSPGHLFLEESLLARGVARLPGLRERYLRTWRHDKARRVPWVLGAALAMRRTAFEAIGGFDPEYFMYYEEIDLCYRLRAQGWEVHFAPVTTIMHLGGVSTSQQRAKMQYRLFQSMTLFYARHYARRQTQFLRLVLIPLTAARLGYDALRAGLRHDAGQITDRLAVRQTRVRILHDCLFPGTSWAP